ncbi:MAG: nodulation protein [Desulfobacterales bacterium]|nr:nodulation protein [Desulfobacterales bacterium]
MIVVGLAGYGESVYENKMNLPYWLGHDTAAVLLKDGKVLAGSEEERLNRIKHTNKMWAQSLRFCLESSGITPRDVDAFACNLTEESYNMLLKKLCLHNPKFEGLTDARAFLTDMISRQLNCEIDPGKIMFVHHHLCHAESAYFHSGYDNALVLTADGQGDMMSGSVYSAWGSELEHLKFFSASDSLGDLYTESIRFLGYKLFDEYKVMGLAPYGDPGKYRDILNSFYQLLPDGEYRIFLDRIVSLYSVLTPRKKGEPFTQTHKDIAASLQEALEKIMFHILTHYQKVTAHKNICLAGGVAHNCTVNGKILYSGMFEDIFVQPAAHDAGCALGAALHVHNSQKSSARPEPVRHVFWGTDIGDNNFIQKTLELWKPLVQFEKQENICKEAARLMADGAVIGWVQGRSEFGPRALGNRSILADPRPAENKERINMMVKKREGYRPFAPSVLEEYVDEYFETNGKKSFPFMIFVLNVNQDKRESLGAITHVDGTARIQSVSGDTNPMYWQLINEFRKITGIPIVLNTSFNNNAEPIVDSLEDSIACYLTTGLNYFVAGDYLVSKKNISYKNYLDMTVSLPIFTGLRKAGRFVSENEFCTSDEIYCNFDGGRSAQLSSQAYELLTKADKEKTLGDLCRSLAISEEQTEEVINEIVELWSQRLVVIEPLRNGLS